MGQILLQDYVPYDRSIKWNVHHGYFGKKGSDAWLKGDVPYYVTSNTAAARQHATVVHAAIRHMKEDGTLPAEGKLHVLEIASGLGAFALHFMQQFEDIDREAGTGFYPRLAYLFTDYAHKTVEDGSRVAHLQELRKSGHMEFYVVDALEPTQLRALDGTEHALPSSTVAVLANYLHCCLPLTVLRKTPEGIHEKHLRVSITAPDGEDPDAVRTRVQNDPTGMQIQGALIEESRFDPASEQIFRNPYHQKVLQDVTAPFPVATVVYPYGTLQHLEKVLPAILPGAVVLISDKGYASADYMEGERECAPSIHGNSFAHSTNFPFFCAAAEHLGGVACQTTNPDYSLQTMLLEKRAEHRLRDLFLSLFMESNRNERLSDFNRAGRRYEDEENHSQAARFYRYALEEAPQDVWVMYRLGSALASLGQYAEALRVLQEGKARDAFCECDYPFRLGYVYHSMGDYSAAIPWYEISLMRESSPVTHYNVGLCHEHLGSTAAAIAAFQRAVAADPAYEKAQERLRELTGAAA